MPEIRTILLGAALGAAGLGQRAAAQPAYAPVPVTGYTQDVIANGAGPAAASTTSDMDNGAVGNRFCFVAADYVSPSGATPTNSLALSGIINSLATPGVTYKLGSAAGNNSLRLTAAGSAGTLAFTTPQAAGYVYLLGASGNGSSTFTATVNFSDGTWQPFAGRTLADWFGGANPVIQGVGRVNYDSNALQGGTDPRLYEVPLSLLAANYARTIQSITIQKTSSAGALNILAVSVGAICPGPLAGGAAAASATRLCPGMSTGLSASGTSAGASVSYQWQASADGGLTWPDVAGATALTYSATPAATTQYRLRVVCGGGASFSAPVTVAVESRDAATLAYGGASFCQVSGATASPAASPAGGTFAGTPGLVVNPSTGVINLAASTAGAHTVTYTSAGFCPATATAAFTLAVAPAATLAYGGSTYCQAAANPVPTAAPAGGTFTGTPGLVLDPATGAIALAQSTPGLHTVTYTLAGACATPASASLRIEATANPEFYNVITPNGDAKNDYLTVSLPSVSDYEMQVYNRWGKRVWQSTNPSAHWAAEGNAAGVYYYWVRFADCSGQTQTHRSWVEVIK